MIEQTILANLIHNPDYCRKVIPYLKEEYFDELHTKKIFDSFIQYVNEYREAPSLEALNVSLDNRKDLNEETFKEISKAIYEYKIDDKTNQEWLLKETERFCQDKDLHNSIRKSILILDGKEKQLDKGSIPKILEDSLSISFDTKIGHDFTEDYESRYEYYNRKESRIPFDLDILNKITQGGLPPKCLVCFLGTTGSGKSLVMCHMAAANFMQGKNVLYVTLELAEEEVSRRIDANLMDVPVTGIADMGLETYTRRIERIKSKTTGKLIVKEYPTGSMSANHLRHAINELKIKKNFAPDIIYLDYINLCSSYRVKNNAANSYTIVKSIAEEMRGLAMEYGFPIVTATQATRSGYNGSDLDITDTSECIFVDENVTLRSGDNVKISDVKPGQQLETNDGYKTVMFVHHPKPKECYKIKMKSGKTITCSSEHVFPTKNGRISISTGLKPGDILSSK